MNITLIKIDLELVGKKNKMLLQQKKNLYYFRVSRK